MADAIQLLTSDHQEVQRLFGFVSNGGAPPEVINSIVRELSIHDAIERVHLYPALRDRAEDGAALSEEAIDEHGEVAMTLAEIDRRAVDDTAMPELLTSLIEMVREHVAEEEEAIFPRLRAALTAEELEELGQALEKEKKRAPTRPHPHVPKSGTSTKLTGLAAGPMDRIRDKVQGRA